jgi:hypothetical protein
VHRTNFCRGTEILARPAALRPQISRIVHILQGRLLFKRGAPSAKRFAFLIIFTVSNIQNSTKYLKIIDLFSMTSTII